MNLTRPGLPDRYWGNIRLESVMLGLLCALNNKQEKPDNFRFAEWKGEIRLVPALQDSIRLVRETGAMICPNLLNRMQNDEGWLTHLSAGVGSQSEIPSTNHLHHKGKAKAVKPSLIYS